MNESLKSPERIFLKDEVFAQIARFAESPEPLSVVREFSDENGLYYLEAKTEAQHDGESTVYEFQRKGRFPGGLESSNTNIIAAFYDGDMPVSGRTIADFDDSANEWRAGVR